MLSRGPTQTTLNNQQYRHMILHPSGHWEDTTALRPITTYTATQSISLLIVLPSTISSNRPHPSKRREIQTASTCTMVFIQATRCRPLLQPYLLHQAIGVATFSTLPSAVYFFNGCLRTKQGDRHIYDIPL